MINGLTLSDYEEVVGSSVINELRSLAGHLKGKKILMVNSTAVGGGVAEMLHRIVPLLNELGVETRWHVIKGGEDFFNVTKKFHNGLQGNEVTLTDRSFKTYLDYNKSNTMDIDFDADMIVIHDPQPAALINFRPAKSKRSKWVWRCHIDLSNPNPLVWDFLKPIVSQYDASIFSSPRFAWKLPIPQYCFYPCIDPLSDKNKELETDYVEKVFEKYEIPRDKPILTQVSRYDRFKDPIGVIKAFKAVKKHVDCRLVLAGDCATDDPEGLAVLEEVKKKAKGEKDIHTLLFNPSVASEINSLQRGSTIVLQKSLKEGFALTVTEALWKKRPVIGTPAGGIPIQIIHNVTGVIVHSVEGAEYQIRYLLSNPEFAQKLGLHGHEHAKINFLVTGGIKRYLVLMLVIKNAKKNVLSLV